MEKHVTLADGAELFIELIDGDENSPVLVFLHEGLGSVAMWGEFPRLLCQQTGCAGIVYDRRGYGKSKPAIVSHHIHYKHDYALQELPQVVSALIPDRDYILVGHSDGGSISLIHAAENPTRLRAIITEAPHVFVETITLSGIAKAAQAWSDGKLHKLENFHGNKAESVFRAWADIWLSDGFRHWNIEYALPSIECPTLVIQGVEDQYGTEQQVSTIVSSVKAPESRMIPDCGHSPHHEQPELVLMVMKDFILRQIQVQPDL